MVIIPLLLFGSYVTYLKVQAYHESRSELAMSTLNGMSSIFESMNDSIYEVLITFSKVDAFQKKDLSQADRKLIETLMVEYSVGSQLQDIAFGTVNGEMFTPNKPFLPDDYDPRYRPWYMDAARLSGQVIISPPYRDARNPSNWTISYALQVLDDTGEPTGVLGTDLKLKGIEESFNKYFSHFEGRIIILDSNSNIIIEKKEGAFELSTKTGIAFDLIRPDAIGEVIDYDNTSYYMDKKTIADMNWCVVLLTPRDKIFNDIVNLLMPLMGVLILVLFIMHRMTRTMHSALIEPLEEFSKRIDGVDIDESGIDLSFDKPVPKEINVINGAVNRMIERINSQSIVLQEQKQEIHGQYEEINALYEETTAMNDSLNDLVDQLQDSYRTTIYSLSSAIEANDTYTKGHCDRVKEYALEMGEEIGLNESELLTLEYAAILHDVGKVGVPTDILNKQSRLTEEEYEIIKKHPAIGAQILKDIPYLQSVCTVIEQHHERVDGKGYPKGLKEHEIHPYALILCIADAYDAMTSIRPYRDEAMPKDQAVAELKRNAGTQFSQRMVDAFIEIIQKEEKEIDK